MATSQGFSLYLVHYPTLHLLDATLPATLPAYNLWLSGFTLAICFGFAALFERPLRQFRSMSHRIWALIAQPQAEAAEPAH